MTWLEFAPVVLAAVIWLVLPGALALWILGVRGLLLYAGSGPVSIAFLAALAIGYGNFGIAWTPWTAAAAVAMAAAVLAIIRLVLRGRWPWRARLDARPAWRWSVFVACGFAVVAIGAPLLFAFGTPDAISQTFDSGFHLNAVRFVLDTGNASTLAIAGVTGSGAIYPAAWHDLTSLVAMAPGSGSIPAAANAVDLAVATIVWSSGVLVLARVIAPHRVAAIWIAAVVSASLPWFPLLPLTFGVLFPYFLALAMLPLGLALVVSVVGRGDALTTPTLMRVLLLAAVCAAMLLSQPSVVLGLVAASLPVVATALIWVFRATSKTWHRVAIIAGALAVLAVFAIAWRQLGAIGYTSPWDAEASSVRGAFEVVTYTFESGPPAIGLALLVAIGVVVSAIKPGRRWIAGMWFIGALLYFASVVLPASDLRNVLLGVFYKDIPRLASFYAVLSIPAALLGGLAVWSWLSRLLARRPAGRGFAAAVTAVVALVAYSGMQAPAMISAIETARMTYALTDRSPILSTDERALIERLPQATGGDGLIAGNPWTGTNFAYALVGQPVLNPHFNTVPLDARTIVNSGLDDAAQDAEVCDAVRALGIAWVLDFGTFFEDAADELHFPSWVGYEGFVGLDRADGFIEVDREGDAVLYRVDACD